MFDKLNSIVDPTAVPAQDPNLELDFDDLLTECLEGVSQIGALRMELSELLETHANLENLQNSISENGLSKTLLAFADKDGLLSKHVPNMPSLESLQADLSVEDSAAALEGLKETTANVLKAIHDKWIQFLHAAANTFGTRLRVIRQAEKRAGEIHTAIEGKHFSIDVASATKGKFFVARELLKHLDAALHVHERVMPFFRLEIPTTAEETREFNKKYAELLVELRDDYLIRQAAFTHKGIEGKKQTLKEAGYDTNSFGEIYGKMSEYFHKFEGEEHKLLAEVEALVEKQWDELRSRSGGDRIKDAINNTNLGVVLGQPFTTKTKHVYAAAVKIIEATYDAVWYSYLAGPANGLRTLKSLKRAYVA